MSQDFRALSVLFVAVSFLSFFSMKIYARETVLSGLAALDNPISDATVTIYDSSGNELYKEADATNSNGAFLVETSKPLPDSFKVTVQGHCHGQSVTLSALQENFYPETSPVWMNAFTTLTCRYAELHATSVEGARAHVANLLTLPERMDTGMKLCLAYPSTRYFNHAKFMTAANAAGGFDAYVQTLVDGSVTRSVSFSESSRGAQRGFITDGFKAALQLFKPALKEAGKALSTGAMSKVGGEAIGWLLSILSGGTLDTDEKFAEINSKLDALQDQIDDLSSQVAAEHDRTRYDNLVSDLNTAYLAPLGNIDQAYILLKQYAQAEGDDYDQSKVDYQRARLASLINDNREKLEDGLQAIHNTMMGVGGMKGITELWPEIVNNFDGCEFADDYYEAKEARIYEWMGVQTKMLNYILEDAHHNGDENLEVVKDYAEQILANLDEQEAAIPPRDVLDGQIEQVGKKLSWRHEAIYPHDKYETRWINFGSRCLVATEDMQSLIDAGWELAEVEDMEDLFGLYAENPGDYGSGFAYLHEKGFNDVAVRSTARNHIDQDVCVVPTSSVTDGLFGTIRYYKDFDIWNGERFSWNSCWSWDPTLAIGSNLHRWDYFFVKDHSLSGGENGVTLPQENSVDPAVVKASLEHAFPDAPDEDGNGVPDAWEVLHPDVEQPDSDGDGIPDAWETLYPEATEPFEDPDGDGLTNFFEYKEKTNPMLSDTDGDGMSDKWELLNSLNPNDPKDAQLDYDGDGLTNREEAEAESDPWCCPLEVGWNMISPVREVKLSAGAQVFSWNAAQQMYQYHSSEQTVEPSVLKPGHGYWFYAEETTDFNVRTGEFLNAR